MNLTINEDYPKNSLGFWWQAAVALFGKESPSVKLLEDKIKDSQKGAMEKVTAHESQMVYLLMTVHDKGKQV